MKKLVLLMLAFVTAVMPVGSVAAIFDSRLDRYAENSIFFYDPDCDNVLLNVYKSAGDNYESGEGEKWNGKCTDVNTQRSEWLITQVETIRRVAAANYLPWELIAGQAFMERDWKNNRDACAGYVDSFNPLGLKGSPACDSSNHRKFNSYEEAYQYYVNAAHSIQSIKGKFANDPYSAIYYIQYGVPHGQSYAQCSKESYLKDKDHVCYGHNLGDPTPGYVKNVSSLICGIQKWAKERGIPISSVTEENYSDVSKGYGASTEAGSGSVGVMSYCYTGTSDTDDDEDDEDPEAGNLADFVKKWAWPDYKGTGFTERMPAYANYIDTQATYTGATCDNGTKGVDCGAFVANIIKASGWDPNYPQGSTAIQMPWLQSNWKRINDVSKLKLGDVGIKTGHVILYVGDIPGFNSKTALASACTGPSRRAPMAGYSGENLNNYAWYRKK